jgi:hypothetical protein
MSGERFTNAGAISTERKLLCPQRNIMDVPQELLLEIFSYLNVRDICQRVAPVYMEWSILARHSSLRKELYFYEDISTFSACKLLRGSPLLRKLRLRGRYDTNDILQQVFESNRRIETIELFRCRGSVDKYEVNGDILGKILEVRTNLTLNILGTVVKSLEFYRLLGRLDDRTKSFNIGSSTREEILCYLEALAHLPTKRKGTLNGESKDAQAMIARITQDDNVKRWRCSFPI